MARLPPWMNAAAVWALLALALATGVAGLRIRDSVGFLAYLGALLGALLLGRVLLRRTGHPDALGALFRASPRATRWGGMLALLAFPFVFTAAFRDPHWVYVATLAGIYVCLALGLNIVVGLAGLLDLGYVAFYAVGAYSSALVSLHFPQYWWALWLWVPCSVLLAAGFGVTLGFPTLRLRGDYLAIVTLGFGEIVRIVLNNWDSVTRGPKGLFPIPSPRLGPLPLDAGLPFVNKIAGFPLWTHQVNYYLVTVAYAALIAVFAARIDGSRVGRAWRAIREDELAAQAMGIDTTRLKLLAFGIGASFAGIAGLLFAHMQTAITPESFVFMESAMILCMVVLGGMGSIPGVVLGAVILAVLPEKLRTFEQYRMVAFGLALVAMMVLRPEGLLPRRAAAPAARVPSPGVP